ncbi:potassium transporter 5 [Amborella trichopoda]|uniref:potassium transporter 5 n=1 Tax=Amborella trichopoda TaxID=13333 RepID=UPI0009BFF89D|nr:potassium transporter 5 [Amborella trichopoda]|eukprot:XP_020529872.1 potassium transporter 5 [Amborella trichopoda]
MAMGILLIYSCRYYVTVFSAVGGIKGSLTEGWVVSISVAILVCIFLVQRFGTDKVGYSFAPIIIVWFLFIGVIGIYNFCKYDPGVIKAFNPKYIVDYFSRSKKDAWISLGGIVLCITGTEAMFADLGHFTVQSIQISMCSVVCPSLILAYTGQASYLRKHNEHVEDTFYKSIPSPLYWTMFVVAVGAAIIASQAMISGTFSIVQQSLAMGCFPRVKVVHTSSKYEGEVFIPEVNYLLMIACVLVTAGFRATEKIGNAYGIAIVFVMTLTTALVTLVMVMIWKTNIFLILAFVLVIGSVELLYLTSVLYEFTQGGYFPLAFAAFLMTVMSVWSMVHLRKYNYELQHKVPTRNLLDLTTKPEVHRVLGIGLFYSELVEGVPPIFSHYIDDVPAVHKVLVFVSMKWLPIGWVPQDERFLFRRVGPCELGVFRCIVRYGYTDAALVHGEFEARIVEGLKQFINSEHMWSMGEDGEVVARESNDKEEVERELREVEKVMSTAVVYLVGQTEVVDRSEARWWEKVLIDYLYTWLRRNVRQGVEVLRIPHTRMVKVGMTYEL